MTFQDLQDTLNKYSTNVFYPSVDLNVFSDQCYRYIENIYEARNSNFLSDIITFRVDADKSIINIIYLDKIWIGYGRALFYSDHSETVTQPILDFNNFYFSVLSCLLDYQLNDFFSMSKFDISAGIMKNQRVLQDCNQAAEFWESLRTLSK